MSSVGLERKKTKKKVTCVWLWQLMALALAVNIHAAHYPSFRQQIRNSAVFRPTDFQTCLLQLGSNTEWDRLQFRTEALEHDCKPHQSQQQTAKTNERGLAEQNFSIFHVKVSVSVCVVRHQFPWGKKRKEVINVQIKTLNMSLYSSRI